MLATELEPALQRLIDARLDNIERSLMSTDASRAERRQIVAAAEEQIYEMLGRLNRDEPSREDIISVLADLDPPEAYAGSGEVDRQIAARAEIVDCTRERAAVSSRKSILAVVAFTLATISAALALGWWTIEELGLLAVFLFAVPASITGITAICQIAGSSKRQRLWMAVVGAASPMVSTLIGAITFSIAALVGIL